MVDKGMLWQTVKAMVDKERLRKTREGYHAIYQTSEGYVRQGRLWQTNEGQDKQGNVMVDKERLYTSEGYGRQLKAMVNK